MEVRREDTYALVDTAEREIYEPYWKKMINLGCAGDLLRSDMQEQVLTLRRELAFLTCVCGCFRGRDDVE